VGEQVADGCRIFVAGGQLQVRRVVRDGGVQVDLALLSEFGDHGRRDALRAGRPAEHGVRRHRVAGALEGLAIALEEGDPAILDHADGEPDHRRLLHQLPEPRVEQAVVDILPCGLGDGREVQIGGGDMRPFGTRRFVRPHGQQRRAHEERECGEPNLLSLLQNFFSPHPWFQLCT
jgi:hypothetical protein